MAPGGPGCRCSRVTFHANGEAVDQDANLQAVSTTACYIVAARTMYHAPSHSSTAIPTARNAFHPQPQPPTAHVLSGCCRVDMQLSRQSWPHKRRVAAWHMYVHTRRAGAFSAPGPANGTLRPAQLPRVRQGVAAPLMSLPSATQLLL